MTKDLFIQLEARIAFLELIMRGTTQRVTRM